MIQFVPHPDIAPCKSKFDLAVHKTFYAFDYVRIFQDIARKPKAKREEFAKAVFKSLILEDLFFIVYFVCENPLANHPFVVGQCEMVAKGQQSGTLDVWARGHFKSTIITVAETLQFHLKYPERCTGILAYARPAAKKFLRAIKTLCEQSQLLKACFPEILWETPGTQAPKWSEDDGIVFKRKSAARGESTIEAWGLTEGMPTGRHFERLVFDDIETEDIANSPKMLADVFSKFDMAGNLSTLKDTDVTRVIGTYYNHAGPVKKIGDMKLPDGTPIYTLRKVPASDTGTKDGNPVFEDPGVWEKSKMSKHFNSQKLCNPTPEDDVLLDTTFLNPIDSEFLWKNRFKFMVIDQAGDKDLNKSKGDMWSIGIVSILPPEVLKSGREASEEDLGIAEVCLEDLVADQMTHSEAIDTIVRMYMKHGMIMQLGVEKVALSTTEIHIADALQKKGRMLSTDLGNLVLLKPAGRGVENRIESALGWPLNNGKLFYNTAIAPKYRDKLFQEMEQFGFSHPDILNMWAYAYDMFKVFKFNRYLTPQVKSVTKLMQAGRMRSEF